MIITITGDPGSGKSTVGKELAKKLGYKFYSMGDLRGEMAAEKGMTIDEFNKLGETDPSTDKKADEYQTKLATQDKIIIDSRLGWHFLPKAFKIKLTVDEKIAAERILKNPRKDEKTYTSVNELLDANKKRQACDAMRYKKWYGIDTAKAKFDIVIDTTHKTVEEITKEILAKIKT